VANIRDQPFRLAPGLVPEELVGKSGRCPNCGTTTPVPWADKLEFAKQPIEPIAGGGHWVPADISLTCRATDCGREYSLQIPRAPKVGTWTIFGDEAGRYISDCEPRSSGSLHFFCITLVGLHRRRHDRVRRQLAKIKKAIAPDRDPEAWQHHFTDIWSSDGRTGEFALRNKDEKIAHARAFAKIVRDARPELVTMNVSSCIAIDSPSERAKAIRAQKQEMFGISLLTSLQQFRSRGLCVKWEFDNIKDASDGARTEGWAREVFLGLQYTRLLAWLSAGATVLEPRFVQPGSHYLLEIADFVSYCVARDFEKAIRGAQSEFPSSLLGNGFFQGVLRDGSIDYRWSRGLPLNEFFGIQPRSRVAPADEPPRD
jgi:hypothetical protein